MTCLCVQVVLIKVLNGNLSCLNCEIIIYCILKGILILTEFPADVSYQIFKKID